MANVIGMKEIRYLNLFEKITKIRTRFCFEYNNSIIFGVQKPLVPRAIGSDSKNLKKINKIIGKRIRVVALPHSEKNIKDFVERIVKPVEFKDIGIRNGEVILRAGQRNKAALIGRNKRRLHEMQKIIQNFFGKEFKII